MLSYFSYQLLLVFAIFSFGCSSGPQPFAEGKDECAHCKMSITDMRFACQLETKKGKVYKFDDLRCMTAFVQEDKVSKADVKNYYVSDFLNKKKILNCSEAHFYFSAQFKSPMFGNIGAFSNQADLEKVKSTYNGNPILWKDVIK